MSDDNEVPVEELDRLQGLLDRERKQVELQILENASLQRKVRKMEEMGARWAYGDHGDSAASLTMQGCGLAILTVLESD